MGSYVSAGDFYPTVSTLTLSMTTVRRPVSYTYALADGALILNSPEKVPAQCLKAYGTNVERIFVLLRTTYPKWYTWMENEVQKPWGRITLPTRQGKKCFDISPKRVVQSILQHVPVHASEWWIEATGFYLESLVNRKKIQVFQTLRPLNKPVGSLATVKYDWILLKWVEELDPNDRVLTRFWTTSEELTGLQPIFEYLKEKHLDIQEWFSGFYMHWVLQYPEKTSPAHGEMVLKPSTVSYIDIPSAREERSGAWVVRFYLDAIPMNTVWIAVREKDGDVRVYRQAVRDRTFDVVLPGRDYEHFRIIFIHPGQFPLDIPLTIRWTREWRLDAPCSLLFAEAVSTDDSVTIEWEVDRQLYGKSWIIERWESDKNQWQPIHSVPFPAASGFYFPVHYVFVDQNRAIREQHVMYRLVLILSSGIRTVVQEFEAE